MKRQLISLPLLALTGALLASCAFSSPSSTTSNSGIISTSVSQNSVSVSSANVTDTGDASNLKISTSDGEYSIEGSTITIKAGGTYTLSGELNGIIYVDVGDEDEVELDLYGVTLVSSSNSPIFVNNAKEVNIKALKGTVNTISDERAEKESDEDSQGEGAIYARCDLKLSGTGTLNVSASYNNGIHSSDDITLKNMTLTVIAPHHAVNGNDSISIEEGGTFTFVGQGGDGLHTDNSGLSSSSKQKGDINITAGDITIYAATDGIDAAYDVNIGSGQDDDGNTTTPNIQIFTNKKWDAYDGSIFTFGEDISNEDIISYFGPGRGNGGQGGMQPGGASSSSSDKSSVSAKGIKAANTITIDAGDIYIDAYDDGIHANYGDSLENGSMSLGDITISGGTLSILASDDGVHADRYLNLKGGYLYVSSYEGIEANQILVSGGESYIYGSDDGVNATTGSLTAKYEQTGGYLFTAVSPNGDYDALDSNGSISIKGGVTIAAGPSSQMAAAIDADNTIAVTGGSLIYFGGISSNPSTASGVTRSNKSGSYSGTLAITIGSSTITTGTLNYTYSGCTAYSSLGSLSSIKKA